MLDYSYSEGRDPPMGIPATMGEEVRGDLIILYSLSRAYTVGRNNPQNLVLRNGGSIKADTGKLREK
jgi:hypothetical protein